ncbi:glycosyltransferase family 2 protein [Candidatus Pacearchaeota archaeon]|nr:glycosyltransferase family 2 protein [Candidatus Pacearchaeota archaeon]
MPRKMTTSMIIPTYNRPESLKKVLDCYVKQTVRFDEVIIVDDSDNNETKKLCGKYKKLHIVYFKKKPEQRGMTISTNKGIRLAKGDIIFLSEDDMLVKKDYVEATLRFFEDNPNAVGMNWYPYSIQKETFNPWKNAVMRFFMLGQYKKDTSKVLATMSEIQPFPLTKEVLPVERMCTGTCAVKKKYMKEFRFDEKLTEYPVQDDLDWSYRLYKKYGNLYLLKANKALHNVSFSSRMPSKKIYYSKIIYVAYLFKKDFNQTWKNLSIFWWGMLGRAILRTIGFIIRPSQKSYDNFRYTLGALISLIFHFKNLEKNPNYFKRNM